MQWKEDEESECVCVRAGGGGGDKKDEEQYRKRRGLNGKRRETRRGEGQLVNL